MYNAFYGFSDGPFDPRLDPRFLYMSASRTQYLSGMLSAVREQKGITVITGEPGTGKTTLLRALLSQGDEEPKLALIAFTFLEFRDLLKNILRDLGIATEQEDASGLLETLYRYLSERPPDQILSIIIDEAQSLPASVLGEIARLWPECNSQNSQLNVILIGLPELETKLNSQELQNLHVKIITQWRFEAFDVRESRSYIDHRLSIVGGSISEVFEAEAIDLICECAGGNPRVINTLCDRSLLTAYSNSKRKIDAAVVRRAIDDLRLPKPADIKSLPDELKIAILRAQASTFVSTSARTLRKSLFCLLRESVRYLRPLLEYNDDRQPPIVAYLRWKPIYQVSAALLLIVMALGLFPLLIPYRTPLRETDTKLQAETAHVAARISEESSKPPRLIEETKRSAPAALRPMKTESPQRLRARQQKPARRKDSELIKQFALKRGLPPAAETRSVKKDADAERGNEHRDVMVLQQDAQRLISNRVRDPGPAKEEADALLAKQDTAWRLLQR